LAFFHESGAQWNFFWQLTGFLKVIKYQAERLTLKCLRARHFMFAQAAFFFRALLS